MISTTTTTFVVADAFVVHVVPVVVQIIAVCRFPFGCHWKLSDTSLRELLTLLMGALLTA